MATPETLTLAAEFPPATEVQWRALVDGVLKGAPFERLVGKTYDGLKIQPIYPRARDAPTLAGRTPAAPWQIMQRIDHPDAAQANAQALLDLENGATGLSLVFAGASSARGFGLEPTPAAIARVLNGVFLDAGIALELELGAAAQTVPLILAEWIKQNGVAPGQCAIRFGLDPIGASAAAGGGPMGWAETGPAVAGAMMALHAMGFNGPFAAADGRVIHDAGGSEAQELAFVLASAVDYLRALETSGVALDAARGMIYARLAADADQFLTMAKIRALRLLWARIEEACGLQPRPLFIAAETAWRMLTQRDPAVNLLRATMATFSAGVAGANAVTVLPHTLAIGLPDGFARRAARNTQLVLIEEANLAKVGDPAAGSGGIEALTRALCTEAWTQFQEIEAAGGAMAALEKNLVQQNVAATRAARLANVAKRKDVFTGASEFPNLQETMPAVLIAREKNPHSPSGQTKQTSFEALAPLRLAAPFEALRDSSDTRLSETGKRPKILLVNLGTPADSAARATFAKNFFEAGGIEAVEFSEPLPDDADARLAVGGVGFGRKPSSHRHLTPAEARAYAVSFALKKSKAKLACLCSSDAVYAVQAAEAAEALREAGAAHIVVAGRPGEQERALRDAGVDAFIFAGCDALAALQAAWVAIP